MIESILFCGTLAALLLLALRDVQRRLKRATVFARRDAASISVQRDRHFAALGLDAASCEYSLQRIARTFNVPCAQLRHTDRFDHELRNLDHLLDGWLLLTLVAAEAGLSPESRDEIKTVSDFVVASANAYSLARWSRQV